MALVAATSLDMQRVHLAGFVHPACVLALQENTAREDVISPAMQTAHQEWFVVLKPRPASKTARPIATILIIAVASNSGFLVVHPLGQRRFCLMDIIARWP